jgi:hypothetical protein
MLFVSIALGFFFLRFFVAGLGGSGPANEKRFGGPEGGTSQSVYKK